VAALALSQERELRAWLYGDNHPTNENLRSEVESVSREIEQLYGVPVDSVIVGDTPATAKTRVLTSALREALANAVRHGKPPISLYVEVSGQEVEAYVRDHGAGRIQQLRLLSRSDRLQITGELVEDGGNRLRNERGGAGNGDEHACPDDTHECRHAQECHQQREQLGRSDSARVRVRHIPSLRGGVLIWRLATRENCLMGHA